MIVVFSYVVLIFALQIPTLYATYFFFKIYFYYTLPVLAAAPDNFLRYILLFSTEPSMTLSNFFPWPDFIYFPSHNAPLNHFLQYYLSCAFNILRYSYIYVYTIPYLQYSTSLSPLLPVVLFITTSQSLSFFLFINTFYVKFPVLAAAPDISSSCFSFTISQKCYLFYITIYFYII